jgi:DNA-binding transcriptional LysR family regulator
VRISASQVMSVELLPPILAPLQDRHPALQIELSASDAIEDLLHREADIAVRTGDTAQEALVVRRIGTIPLGMFGHRRYLERHGTPDSIAELARHRLIGHDRETAYMRLMARRYPKLAELAPGFRSDSNLVQLAAIRAGAGLGICQVPLATADPDLVRVLPRAFEAGLDTFVAMHENLKSSPRCRAVFDALVTGLQAYLGGRRRSGSQAAL